MFRVKPFKLVVSVSQSDSISRAEAFRFIHHLTALMMLLNGRC